MHNLVKYPGLIILIASVTSCLSAQAIKIFINLLRFRKLDFKTMIRTGGMPSSHSAMVSSLATGIALVEGVNSAVFDLAIVFALIVMYDASGVRRSVGIQAGILNKMINEMTVDNPQLQLERIKEFIGHTPYEVFAGALFGIGMGFLFCHQFVAQ